MSRSAVAISTGSDEGPLEWIKRGECRGVDTNVFFTAASVEFAKSICARCPVRQPCVDYALIYERRDTADKDMGVYGGMTYEERRSYGRRRRTAARRAQND